MSKRDHLEYDSDQSLPPHPASGDLAWGARVLVILAIMTSVMQGSFVVSSSHDMHLWSDVAALAKGAAPWSVDAPKGLELPPFKQP